MESRHIPPVCTGREDRDRSEKALHKVSGSKAGGGFDPTPMFSQDDMAVIACTPIFSELTGDENSQFQLELFSLAMKSFADVWKPHLLSDDFAFQSAFRWLAAMYYFLGGTNFPKEVAIVLRVSESTIGRWLNGHSVPVPRIRSRALKTGAERVSHLEIIRRNGAQMQDLSVP